jgi:hypothetical protein
VVEVGNEKSTFFWTSSWISGKAAKNIAPRLFAKCKRKKIKVDKALNNNKWIEHLLLIIDANELREYVDLWEVIHQIPINSEVEDNIRWRWTASGKYTTSSAYNMQFAGAYSKLRLTPIWKAQTEPRYKFFAWTLLHRKILTANNNKKELAK